MKLKEYIEYGVKALKERRESLVVEYSKATNPLDRLSFRDKVEEIDIALKYFSKYEDVLAEQKEEK